MIEIQYLVKKMKYFPDRLVKIEIWGGRGKWYDWPNRVATTSLGHYGEYGRIENTTQNADKWRFSL